MAAKYWNGKEWIDLASGEQGPQGPAGNGISSAVLNADYTLTLNFTNGSSYTTPSIRGEQGEQGPQGEDGADGAVTGVKGSAESTYRTGNVSLSAANVNAYQCGSIQSQRNAGNPSADPQYANHATLKNQIEAEMLKPIAGIGDYFYAAHLNPTYTISCNYEGVTPQYSSASYKFAKDTLFNPKGNKTCNLDVDEIALTPFVLEVTWPSSTATDVTHLELWSHNLGDNAGRLTDYKVELYTTGTNSNSGTYTWQTVYERTGVSDKINGLSICLNPSATYSYLYFKGVRFTISGATPASTAVGAWNRNCISLTLFRLMNTRPEFTAADAVGALDKMGGTVFGATTFLKSVTASGGVTGNLTGMASKATGDESGNNIKASYASSLGLSDNTLSLNNKNGTALSTVTLPTELPSVTSSDNGKVLTVQNGAWAAAAGGGGGGTWTKLWENENPTSNFSAQTVPLDLSGWSWIAIKVSFNRSTADYGATHILQVGDISILSAENLATASYTAKRQATVSASGVTFGGGYRTNTNTSGNTYCVPQAIYGVC